VHLDDPDLPDYLISWETIYARLPEKDRALFAVALTSNPTALDGSGAMVLLRRTNHPASPASNSLQVRTNGMPREATPHEARERRSAETALTNLGSTSAEPPPRLTLQIGVISES
jgi:hypothetical protein